MNADRTALFVRLSAPLMVELDERVRRAGRTKQAVVEELLTSQLASSSSATDDEILDLEQAAALLRVPVDAVLERIEDGDFPARRFGAEWRISTAAITAWLHGTDTIEDRRTGFA